MTLYDHVTLATIRYSKRLRTRRLQHNRLIWQMAWLVSLSLSLSHSLSLSLCPSVRLYMSLIGFAISQTRNSANADKPCDAIRG